MDEKKYRVPPVAWLKVTDYMHGWLQHELGGAARIGDQRVVCVQHLPGARDILRMETEWDVMDAGPVGNAMSATRRNIVSLGLVLDKDVMAAFYGVTEEQLKLFVPVECPPNGMTRCGVLRPWSLEMSFGREQAKSLQRLLRAAFWEAVREFDAAYAEKMGGWEYPTVEMVEAFCKETGTSEVHVAALRREWDRRTKRERDRAAAEE